MAERRMFHTTVVESDAFLDLPLQAQALYFHLGMHADDDGFVNSPKQITRRLRIPVAKLQLLMDAGFLLEFPGVVVLRHWRVANSLRKDRMKPLLYPEFAQRLYIQPNGLYTLAIPDDTHIVSLYDERLTKCQPSGNQMRHKVKEGKIREGKIREDKLKEDNIDAAVAASDTAATADKNLNFIKGDLGKGVVLLSQEQITDLVEKMDIDCFDYYVEKLARFIQDKQASVKNHYLTILKWWEEDKKYG